MTSPSRQILPRTIASTLLFVEGAVVLALGAWMIFFGFTHENREILPLLGVVLFAIAGGLGLIQCGRGYKAGKNYVLSIKTIPQRESRVKKRQFVGRQPTLEFRVCGEGIGDGITHPAYAFAGCQRGFDGSNDLRFVANVTHS